MSSIIVRSGNDVERNLPRRPSKVGPITGTDFLCLTPLNVWLWYTDWWLAIVLSTDILLFENLDLTYVLRPSNGVKLSWLFGLVTNFLLKPSAADLERIWVVVTVVWSGLSMLSFEDKKEPGLTQQGFPLRHLSLNVEEGIADRGKEEGRRVSDERHFETKNLEIS